MIEKDKKQIIDIIHKTIYSFFDVCEDNEETPITEKDKMLLKVNKVICNKILELESCEDCISRKALLEEVENGIKAGNYEEGYEEYPHINDMDDIIECIKYADSVYSNAEQEPNTGRWIYADGNSIPYCSKCGALSDDADRGIYFINSDSKHRESAKFCPNCGANMRK